MPDLTAAMGQRQPPKHWPHWFDWALTRFLEILAVSILTAVAAPIWIREWIDTHRKAKG